MGCSSQCVTLDKPLTIFQPHPPHLCKSVNVSSHLIRLCCQCIMIMHKSLVQVGSVLSSTCCPLRISVHCPVSTYIRMRELDKVVSTDPFFWIIL